MTANNVPIPPPAAERGPEKWEKLSDEDRTLLDTVKAEDFRILNTVMARLWKSSPLADNELVLEVIDKTSPYKGVLFNVQNFEVLPVTLQNGMVPVKFEVKIFKKPYGWEQDEAFDNYAREVFIAWLSYIQTHEFRTVATAAPQGSIQ